jgi:hypothetical protein
MDDLYLHRHDRYMDLGFSERDADVLAGVKWPEQDSQGRTWVRPLHWMKVAKALESGCSHELALRIFG